MPFATIVGTKLGKRVLNSNSGLVSSSESKRHSNDVNALRPVSFGSCSLFNLLSHLLPLLFHLLLPFPILLLFSVLLPTIPGADPWLFALVKRLVQNHEPHPPD